MKASGNLLALCSFATASHFQGTRTAAFSDSYFSGFEDPTVVSSVGGHAVCIQRTLFDSTDAMNLDLRYAGPANQTALSQTMQEYLQTNSTLASQVIQSGLIEVSGTYGIYSQLCFPAVTGMINSSTVRFLIHGVGFDRTSWNFQAGYSYVDKAALAGYTTFFFDRLSNGKSDHPDPIQVVQTQMESP